MSCCPWNRCEEGLDRDICSDCPSLTHYATRKRATTYHTEITQILSELIFNLGFAFSVSEPLGHAQATSLKCGSDLHHSAGLGTGLWSFVIPSLVSTLQGEEKDTWDGTLLKGCLQLSLLIYLFLNSCLTPNSPPQKSDEDDATCSHKKISTTKQKQLFRVITVVGTFPDGHSPFGMADTVQKLVSLLAALLG